MVFYTTWERKFSGIGCGNDQSGKIPEIYYSLEEEIMKISHRISDLGDFKRGYGEEFATSSFIHAQYVPLVLVCLEGKRFTGVNRADGRILLGARHFLGETHPFSDLEEIARKFDLTPTKYF